MTRRPTYPGRPHPLIARLREIREDRDITQREMARRLGLHPNVFCTWEIGRARPRLEDLDRWAALLGLRLGFHVQRRLSIQDGQNDGGVGVGISLGAQREGPPA